MDFLEQAKIYMREQANIDLDTPPACRLGFDDAAYLLQLRNFINMITSDFNAVQFREMDGFLQKDFKVPDSIAMRLLRSNHFDISEKAIDNVTLTVEIHSEDDISYDFVEWLGGNSLDLHTNANYWYGSQGAYDIDPELRRYIEEYVGGYIKERFTEMYLEYQKNNEEVER